VIRTALAICDGGVVRRIDLPREIRETYPLAEPAADALARGPTLSPLRVAERAALSRIIEEHRGNMTRTAAHLGISRNTLYRKMKRHGIPLPHRH